MLSISRGAFERIVDRALLAIPKEFQELLENVAVIVEDRPSDDLLREMEVPEDEDLLGAYLGQPIDERSFFDLPSEPDRILIFRLPLLESCETKEELLEEIEITVVHEIAHHFGIEEDTLARFGYD